MNGSSRRTRSPALGSRKVEGAGQRSTPSLRTSSSRSMRPSPRGTSGSRTCSSSPRGPGCAGPSPGRGPCAATDPGVRRREGPGRPAVHDPDRSQLHASAVKRSVAWSTVAPGRRIHDLRHTAACLWLSKGADPVTVQAWLGHASIATTNVYLHHLGSSADRAGLERLNALGGRRGAHHQGVGA